MGQEMYHPWVQMKGSLAHPGMGSSRSPAWGSGEEDVFVCGAARLLHVLPKVHKHIKINTRASLAHQYCSALSSPVSLKGFFYHAHCSPDECDEGSGRILHAFCLQIICLQPCFSLLVGLADLSVASQLLDTHGASPPHAVSAAVTGKKPCTERNNCVLGPWGQWRLQTVSPHR